jgi:tetratricopeptide (TPR) repeat protein
MPTAKPAVHARVRTFAYTRARVRAFARARAFAVALAAFLIAAQFILPAQPAPQNQPAAGPSIATLNAPAAPDTTAALAALKTKAITLKNLGRHAEALDAIRQAAQLAPGDLGVRMHMGIILDAAGGHREARATYDTIFDTLHNWRAERAALVKKGGKPESTPHDAERSAVALALPQNSAINHVFLGNYARALAQFTSDYEANIRDSKGNDDSDYDACWLLWLTAKNRALEGMKADVAVERLAGTLFAASPPRKEMLKLWSGKGHWQAILVAINGMEASGAEKENHLAEARFFAAGYYRYVKNDAETALELLDAEQTHPFNGCIERLFIREEIAGLRK